VLNYNEIQNPRKKKGIIDFDRLMDLLGFENYDDFKDAHYKWTVRCRLTIVIKKTSGHSALLSAVKCLLRKCITAYYESLSFLPYEECLRQSSWPHHR
jgi:hypothetical protein